MAIAKPLSVVLKEADTLYRRAKLAEARTHDALHTLTGPAPFSQLYPRIAAASSLQQHHAIVPGHLLDSARALPTTTRHPASTQETADAAGAQRYYEDYFKLARARPGGLRRFKLPS